MNNGEYGPRLNNSAQVFSRTAAIRERHVALLQRNIRSANYHDCAWCPNIGSPFVARVRLESALMSGHNDDINLILEQMGGSELLFFFA